jgi:eukaryotic-like serine/threonine-protein kinase
VTLPAGTHLGPYEILAPIGAGGMGEVYRAKDTRLERDVAIKVLPQHLSSSPELRQRFEREAKTISALSHPHICAVYDVGNQDGIEYLVMEHLEGETLAARLVKGPLPAEQTLRYGVEIADALDKAHRQGIVHRDLKPGNVMLTRSGVKLLDFGLAKIFTSKRSLDATGREQAAAAQHPMAKNSLTALPTVAGSAPLTQEGTILGTFQYMAPEQLEGRDADGRSDIFAFGAVLYEMATGRKAFEGKSQASLIAAILTAEPPSVSTIQPMTPPAFDRVVRTCLAKDPEDRWQSAHDIASELKWIAQGSQAGVAAPVARARVRRERWAWIVAAVAVLAAVALAALVLRRPAPRALPIRLSLDPPAKAPFESFDHTVVSPDGRTVAFIARFADGKRSIWLRPLESSTATPVAGTEGAIGLFWSPDGTSIGFFADEKLKRVERSGGAPLVLADAPTPSGGAWNSEGVILFNPRPSSPLLRILASGGAAVPASKLAPKEDGHCWPAFLADGKHYVFLADASLTPNHSLRLGTLGSLESEKLISPFVTNLAFAPPDRILFVRAGTLVSQKLDVSARRLEGAPTPLGEQIATVDYQHGFDFSVSQTGVLVYRSASPNYQLTWYDRGGKKLAAVGEPARYSRIDLAPDENRVVCERLDEDLRHGNLWMLDLARGSASRLTIGASSDYSPVWSPDGRRILYGSARTGLADIYEISSGASGGERLVFGDSKIDKYPLGISPDGRFALLSILSPTTDDDIWILPLTGEGKASPLVASPFSDLDAQIAPDGKWFAYTSNETGRFEVYLQSFADKTSRLRVSTSGGVRPRWRSDGKELFFVAGSVLQSVAISASPSGGIEAAAPKDLFRTPQATDYAVSRDGQKFLIAAPVDDEGTRLATVVLNWNAEPSK